MDIHWVIARRRHLAQRATKDAEFAESDHPRAPDGKFGSGGGKAKEGDLKQVTVKARPAFVSAFVQQHTTISAQEKYLASVPKEKLHTALKLSEGHIDPASTHVRQLIKKELDGRAGSGR